MMRFELSCNIVVVGSNKLQLPAALNGREVSTACQARRSRATANFRDRDGHTLMEHAFTPPRHCTTITFSRNGAEYTPRDVHGLNSCRAIQQPCAQNMPDLLTPRPAHLLQRSHFHRIISDF